MQGASFGTLESETPRRPNGGEGNEQKDELPTACSTISKGAARLCFVQFCAPVRRTVTKLLELSFGAEEPSSTCLPDGTRGRHASMEVMADAMPTTTIARSADACLLPYSSPSPRKIHRIAENMGATH